MFSKSAIKAVRDGIAKGEPISGPFDVQILPLTACNQSCVFCPLFTGVENEIAEHAPRFLEPGKMMDWDLFQRIADGLEQLGGVERVHFTGGEPLLHPGIADMIAVLKGKFPSAKVGIVTNGLSLEKKYDELFAAGVDRINISLNAADKKTYLELSPKNIADDFRKIIKGIEFIGKRKKKSKNSNPDISISCVLTKYNFNAVKKLLDIALKAGASSVTYLPLAPFEYQGKASNKEYMVSSSQFSEFLINVNKFYNQAKKYGTWLGYAGKENDFGLLTASAEQLTSPCFAGFSFIVFWPDGKVRPCCNCEMIMGDVFLNSLSEIWRSEAYREFRNQSKTKLFNKKMRCLCKECGYLFENTFFNSITGVK